MARSSQKVTAPSLEQLVAQAVAQAVAGLTQQDAPKPKRSTGKANTPAKPVYDLTKPATRSQVYRAFFAMAKAHHGLTFGANEWPTSGDVQTILDAIK
jgi:hypothetical protein